MRKLSYCYFRLDRFYGLYWQFKLWVMRKFHFPRYHNSPNTERIWHSIITHKFVNALLRNKTVKNDKELERFIKMFSVRQKHPETDINNTDEEIHKYIDSLEQRGHW